MVGGVGKGADPGAGRGAGRGNGRADAGGPDGADPFAILAAALPVLAAARQACATAAGAGASGPGVAALARLGLDLSALALLARAAREGDLTEEAARREARHLALAAVPPDLAVPPALAPFAVALETLRKRCAAHLADDPTGCEGRQRTAPRWRPRGHPRLHLVVDQD